MKKLLLALILVLFATTSYAASIEILFSYDPPHPSYEAAGYKVYTDGTLFGQADTSVVDADSGFYVLTFVKDLSPGEVVFTMSAIYQNGEESPMSASYSVIIPEPIPDPVGPAIKQIKVILDNGEELIFILQQ